MVKTCEESRRTIHKSTDPSEAAESPCGRVGISKDFATTFSEASRLGFTGYSNNGTQTDLREKHKQSCSAVVVRAVLIEEVQQVVRIHKTVAIPIQVILLHRD